LDGRSQRKAVAVQDRAAGGPHFALVEVFRVRRFQVVLVTDQLNVGKPAYQAPCGQHKEGGQGQHAPRHTGSGSGHALLPPFPDRAAYGRGKACSRARHQGWSSVCVSCGAIWTIGRGSSAPAGPSTLTSTYWF